MKRSASAPTVLSPCQIVAWNLERARRTRGWSQAEMARQLKPYGYRMSQAALSKAERSLYGGAIRRFDADEIFTLARIFNLPPGDFFVPPEAQFRGKAIVMNNKLGDPRAVVTAQPLTRGQVLDLVIRVVSPEPASEAARMREQEVTRQILEAVMKTTTEHYTRAVASGVQSYLEAHPEALAEVVAHGVPKEIFKQAEVNLTPLQQAKSADEIVGLMPKKTARRSR